MEESLVRTLLPAGGGTRTGRAPRVLLSDLLTPSTPAAALSVATTFPAVAVAVAVALAVPRPPPLLLRARARSCRTILQPEAAWVQVRSSWGLVGFKEEGKGAAPVALLGDEQEPIGGDLRGFLQK